MSESNCLYCGVKIEVGHELNGPARYAALGGLQSPCCLCCFEANDYSIESGDQLAVRSMLRRVAVLAAQKMDGLSKGDEFSADLTTPDFAPRHVRAKFYNRVGPQIGMDVISDSNGDGGYRVWSAVENVELHNGEPMDGSV